MIWSVALHRAAGEHELVHAQLAVGERQVLGDAVLAQAREQVVGVQHGGLGGVLQAVAAERADVGVGAHEAAVVALEAAQAPDRLGADAVGVVVEREGPVLALHDDRHGQVGGDALGDGDRPRARAAAAVGLGEGLVQVEVDDVEAHVAGAREAHHGVEVGAVVVERRADAVDDLGDLGDVRVEQAERVGVGQHQAGDVARRPWRAGRRCRRRRRRWSRP